MNDGLKDAYRKAITAILATNPRVERAVLFGSRAMGTHSTTSDVDIALFGDELALDDQASLSSQLSELTMPQEVDLVLYHRIESDGVIDHIKRYGVEWYRKDQDFHV